jgi:AcrR family transcriptional regulator
LKANSSSSSRFKSYDYIKRKENEKINSVLHGTLSALAEKGYANTTMEHIARASNVSRGLLHYYFESKEDLIIQAVSLGSGNLINTAVRRLSHASSTEHLVDILIEVLKQTAEQRPRITALLLEMWGESRRSAKLRNAFEAGFRETIEKLSAFLAHYVSVNSNLIGSRSVEMTSRILLGLYLGLLIQLISQPDLLNDKQFQGALRSLVVHALRDDPAHWGD